MGTTRMLNKIFGAFRKKKNNIQRQIVKVKTETNKYFDSEYNLYRYSKFTYFSDQMDDLYEFIEGSHTIPVPEEVSFEEAASRSISFKENKEDFEKKLLVHQSLINPSKCTKGSTCKYMFEDGSLLTTLSSYKDNSKDK